jgi:hypothetical protein
MPNCAAEARAREILDQIDPIPTRARPARHRPRRVLGADQSRHAAGPADEGRLRRRAARFLLALKVVLADRGSAPTLVFDEIDTGVGGAVADAIGVRLARLPARCR